MGKWSFISRVEWCRRWSFAALVGLLALVLASCSAGSILSDSSPAASSGNPKGRTVPPVSYQQITGIPPDKLSDFKQSLASAGGQHDIGFVEGSFQSGVFSIGGSIRALQGSAGVRVIYEWQFRDAEGVLIDTISGEDNAGVYTGPDAWGAVTAAVLDRIARRTADVMAQRLSTMGYATRLSGLTAPPAEFFAQAGPRAGQEIDFETVHGPGLAALGTSSLADADKVVEHEEIEPRVAAVSPLPGEEVMPRVAVSEAGLMPAPSASEDRLAAIAAGQAPPPDESKEATAVPAKATPGQQPIRAVAVMPVKGSPGSGDAELTAAMRKALSSAGWPVVSRPQADAITIEGHVKLASKDAKTQSVSLRWLVKSPTGAVLGDVKQANDVPNGALDGGWGGAAAAVVEAAATGIFDVVKRYR